MDKAIIQDIARDAAELGRALAEQDITAPEVQAALVAGAMPGIVAYETSATRGSGFFPAASRRIPDDAYETGTVADRGTDLPGYTAHGDDPTGPRS